MFAANYAFRLALAKLIYQNIAIATIGDSTGLRGSSVAGNLYASLHTADPTGGTQITSEAAYPGYARVAIPHSDTGFAVTGDAGAGTVTWANVAEVLFPEAGESGFTGETEVYIGIGAAAAGAGLLISSSAMTPSKAIAPGDQLRIKAGKLTGTVN